MTYCSNCPLAAHDRPCHGNRHCELVDPVHPDHDPRYAATLLQLYGLISAEVRERQKKLMGDRILVVGAFGEDLEWLNRVNMPIALYRKGPASVPKLPWIRERFLPNVGREAHSYLQFICDNYTFLPELVIFAQGDSYPVHSPFLLDLIHWQDLGFTSLTPWYKKEWPGPLITQFDSIQFVGGKEIRYGDAMYYGGLPEARNDPWLATIWPLLFKSPRRWPWRYGYAATYAVPRERILARPLAFWRWLKGQLEGDSVSQVAESPAGKITGFVLELTWLYLFDPSNEVIDVPEDCPETVAPSAPSVEVRPRVQAQVSSDSPDYPAYKRVLTCPERVRPSCGCSDVFGCKKGVNGGQVRLADCLACVRSGLLL